MSTIRHLDTAELEALLPEALTSPATGGTLEGIVVRPDRDLRQTPTEAEVTAEEGLKGDRWSRHCTRKLPDGRLNPDSQLTLMNTRVLARIAGTRDRWELAGDNLLVDLDISAANLPPGQRLRVGTAILEITAHPHTGCSKFSRRFGDLAFRFVNSPDRAALRLRGVHAQVIQPGRIRVGDRIEKL